MCYRSTLGHPREPQTSDPRASIKGSLYNSVCAYIESPKRYNSLQGSKLYRNFGAKNIGTLYPYVTEIASLRCLWAKLMTLKAHAPE